MLSGDARSCYLLLCEEVFDQGAHNLLRGPGCTDVGEDEVAMCLLSIADPALSKKNEQVWGEHRAGLGVALKQPLLLAVT